MSGKGKQTVKMKTASPKTAPGLPKKVTFTGLEEKQGKSGTSKGNQDDMTEGEKDVEFVCPGGLGKTCNKEIKEDTCICCDACNRWYHRDCQLKSAEEFDAVRKFKLFWVCSHCQALIPSLLQQTGPGLMEQVTASLTEFKGLLVEQAGAVAGVADSSKDLCKIQEEAYNDLKRQLDEQASLIKACHISCEEHTKVVTEAVLRIEDKVQQQESRSVAAQSSEMEHQRSYAEAVKSLGARIDAISAREARATVEPEEGATLVKTVGNFFDKEKRKYNIVVHNLPENADQDPKVSNEKDVEAFTNLLKDEFHVFASISKAFRAGKRQQERPRPLIVSLTEEGAKWDILRMAPQLRSSERYKNVFLSPDKTPEEREADRKLRLEAKKLREEGNIVRIQRGKLVIVQPAAAGSGSSDRAVVGESEV